MNFNLQDQGLGFNPLLGNIKVKEELPDIDDDSQQQQSSEQLFKQPHSVDNLFKQSQSADQLFKLPQLTADQQQPATSKDENIPKTKPDLPKLDIDKAKQNQEQESKDSSEGKTPLFDTPTTPHPGGKDEKDKQKREMEEEERERMQFLVSNFTEDQLDRYAMYRRASFPKATIRRIMQTITGSSTMSQNVIIAMSGVAKVFVSEVVETALQELERVGEAGQPIRPKHLREAVRKLRVKGKMPKLRKERPF